MNRGAVGDGSTRRVLALGLLVLLSLSTILSVWLALNGPEHVWKGWLDEVFPPLVTLVGMVVSYYFGSRRRRRHQTREDSLRRRPPPRLAILSRRPMNNLPRVSQTEAAILAALTGGELYGLEIVDEIHRRGGHLSLGGVYPTLHRLQEKGLVTSRRAEDEPVRAGARRRYYTLTALGATVLNEVRRLVGAMEMRTLNLEGATS